jgi:antitoxin component of MazEF toxin-antitoxin module
LLVGLIWSQGLPGVEPIRRKNLDGGFRARIVAPDRSQTPLYKPGPVTIEVENAVFRRPLRMENLDDLIEQVGKMERVRHRHPDLRKPKKLLFELELKGRVRRNKRKEERGTHHDRQRPSGLALNVLVHARNRAQDVVELGHDLGAQVQVPNHLVSQVRVPDNDDLHIRRTEDLETEPRREDLNNEELVRDFRERPGGRIHLRHTPEGNALIGTVVPAWGELDVLERTSRIPQPVPERWVELGGWGREDCHGEYNSPMLQNCRKRAHVRSGTRRVRRVPTALSGERNSPGVEDERGLVCKDGGDIGIEGKAG